MTQTAKRLDHIDIAKAIGRIEAGDLGDVKNVPLDDFDPVRTITNILEAGR